MQLRGDGCREWDQGREKKWQTTGLKGMCKVVGPHEQRRKSLISPPGCHEGMSRRTVKVTLCEHTNSLYGSLINKFFNRLRGKVILGQTVTDGHVCCLLAQCAYLGTCEGTVFLALCLCTRLSVQLSVCLSVCLSFCLYVCLFFRMFKSLFRFQCVC